MTRTVKQSEAITYAVTRLEILDAIRELINAKYPGGAQMIGDRRCMRQECLFLDASGEVLPVLALTITTIYEQPASG